MEQIWDQWDNLTWVRRAAGLVSLRATLKVFPRCPREVPAMLLPFGWEPFAGILSTVFVP